MSAKAEQSLLAPYKTRTDEKQYHSGRLGQRHGLMVIMFLGYVCITAARVGLSVAMVAMVKQNLNDTSSSTNSSSSSSSSSSSVCPKDANVVFNATLQKQKNEGKFDWDSKTQGILHGAFFYGYLLLQIPAGVVADRFGAKVPIAASIFIVGTLTALLPLAAEGGAWLFFTFRLLIGAAQGVVWPSVSSLWSQWAPPAERGRLLSVTYSGSQVGTAFGMFFAGLLADVFGYAAVFYTFGSLCLLWLLPWLFLAFSSPDDHPRITSAEREYIVRAVQGHTSTAKTTVSPNKRPKTPWLKMMTTVPFLAILVAEFGHSWAFYTLQTNLPTYMNNILHFSLKSNGLLSAMPYLIRWGITLVILFLADWLHARQTLSPTVLRKVFSITAFLGTAAALTGVVFAGCNATVAVVLFATGIGMSGLIYAGVLINYSELSVNFAGTLIGIGNTVGTITGIAAPYVVGVLTSGENGGQTLGNWRTVFWISVGMYVGISAVYGVFGSAKRQKWDTDAQ